MNPPRILIAGVTGFLGSRLAQIYIDRGDASISGTCRGGSNLSHLEKFQSSLNLINIEHDNLNSAFKSHRFDVVINCLCDYGRTGSQADVVKANYQLPSQLFELAVEHDVKVFLNAGTSLPANVSDYAQAKDHFSRYLRNRSPQIVAIDARLEHFYGAGESANQFISFLIRQFLKPASELNLTAGQQRRDFIHIDDVISAISLLVEQGINWQAGYYSISVGTGFAHLIRHVVALVQDYTKNSQTVVNFGAVPYREHEVMDSHADTSALNHLGWQPKYTLAEGIKNTVAAYRQLASIGRAA